MKSPLAATLLGLLAATGATAEPTKPTIVLVHGAFADASSWNGGSLGQAPRPALARTSYGSAKAQNASWTS